MNQLHDIINALSPSPAEAPPPPGEFRKAGELFKAFYNITNYLFLLHARIASEETFESYSQGKSIKPYYKLLSPHT
jgi:hypothetical protein